MVLEATFVAESADEGPKTLTEYLQDVDGTSAR
jgi:hypothetical protein